MTFFFWYFATSAVVRILLFRAITYALIATYAYTGSQIALYAVLLHVATLFVFFSRGDLRQGAPMISASDTMAAVETLEYTKPSG